MFKPNAYRFRSTVVLCTLLLLVGSLASTLRGAPTTNVLPAEIIHGTYASLEYMASTLRSSEKETAAELLVCMLLDTSAASLTAEHQPNFWRTAAACLQKKGTDAKEVQLSSSAVSRTAAKENIVFEFSTYDDKRVASEAVGKIIAEDSKAIRFVSLRLSAVMDYSFSPPRLIFQGKCPGAEYLSVSLMINCVVRWGVPLPKVYDPRNPNAPITLPPLCDSFQKPPATLTPLFNFKDVSDFTSEAHKGDTRRQEPIAAAFPLHKQHITLRITAEPGKSPSSLRAQLRFPNVLSPSGLMKMRELIYPNLQEQEPLLGDMYKANILERLKFLLEQDGVLASTFTMPSANRLPTLGLLLKQAYVSCAELLHDDFVSDYTKEEVQETLEKIRAYHSRVLREACKAKTSPESTSVQLIAMSWSPTDNAKVEDYSLVCSPAALGLQVSTESGKLIPPTVFQRFILCSMLFIWPDEENKQAVLHTITEAIFVSAAQQKQPAHTLFCVSEQMKLPQSSVPSVQFPAAKLPPQTLPNFLKKIIAFSNPHTMKSLRAEVAAGFFGAQDPKLKEALINLIDRNTETGDESPHKVFGVPIVEERETAL